MMKIVISFAEVTKLQLVLMNLILTNCATNVHKVFIFFLDRLFGWSLQLNVKVTSVCKYRRLMVRGFLALGRRYLGKNYLCAHQGQTWLLQKLLTEGWQKFLCWLTYIFTLWNESYCNILVTSTKLFNFLCCIKNMDLME